MISTKTPVGFSEEKEYNSIFDSIRVAIGASL